MKSLRVAARIFVFCVASGGLWGAPAVQSGYVNVGPEKIYFETAGSGPAIVFIHDGVVHSRVWDDQFAGDRNQQYLFESASIFLARPSPFSSSLALLSSA